MSQDDLSPQSVVLWEIRSEREQLVNFCYQNGITLAPYWHPSQRFTAPPLYTSDHENLAHTLVLVMALDHPEVPAEAWICVQTGLFNWSGNLTVVDRAGAMGDCHHVKRKRGSSWILVESPPHRMDEWRRWRPCDWPKLLLPGWPVAA